MNVALSFWGQARRGVIGIPFELEESGKVYLQSNQRSFAVLGPDNWDWKILSTMGRFRMGADIFFTGQELIAENAEYTEIFKFFPQPSL